MVHASENGWTVVNTAIAFHYETRLVNERGVVAQCVPYHNGKCPSIRGRMDEDGTKARHDGDMSESLVETTLEV